MRYMFWHGLTDRDWLESKWGEFMLSSPGASSRPAPVTEGLHRLFTRNGRDVNGASVALGLYVLLVDLGADSGDDTMLRPIAVAY